MSPYQRDIWFAESRAPGSPQFNGAVYERFTGAVDGELLRACFTRVLERHDTFRLRFDDAEGVPCQWLADTLRDDGEPVVDLVDLSAEPDPEAACRAWRERTMATPFDLRDRRLFRATLLREGDDAVQLFLKGHHLLLDGRGAEVLHTELMEDYARRARGQEPRDRGPAPSVLAAVTGRDAYFAAQEYADDRAYHRGELALMEPNFFPRRVQDTGSSFGLHTFTLPGAVVESIKESGSTPFAYVAAALGTWLARVHRTTQAVIGVPLLNRRTRAELTAVAQYANTLPLRIEVPEGKPLAGIATDLQESVGDLQQHQRLPIGDLLRELPADGSRERRLFDVTLSYLTLRNPLPLDGVVRGGVSFTAPPHEQEALAVAVVGARGSSDLRIEVRYATDVFDDDLTVTSLVEHLTSLIAHGLDKPELPAGELYMLSAREQETLQRFARGPRVPFADDTTLHALFEERAARFPDRTAVLGDDEQETIRYAELDALANQVARSLRARRVGRDDRVAVLMERGPRMLAAVLGVLKSGGAYVPVDPGYPAARIGHILQDSGAKVVVTDAEAPDLPVPAGTPVCPVDDLMQGSAAALEPVAGPRDLAYVIYTSGSTGRPKGAMVEHRSVVNRLAWMQRALPIGEDDVLLQKTPISFDVSVWELFWWAIEGASVALLPPGGEKDPRQLLDAIAQHRVSVVHFVPSMLGPFLDLLEESPRHRARADSLRHVVCSGEALPPGRVDQFNRVYAGVAGAPALTNLYGPTEATVDVCAHTCPADPGRPVTRVPIGRPIDNTELYVVGPDGTPQPVGVPGELCIGGVALARGYLERPELTREKFVPAPFVDGGRLYRTGDLARWLADGTLEYLGRIDGQVKIRGNRVEPGEVRDALVRIHGVRDAAVVDRTSPGRGTYLVGYWTGEDDLDPRWLREQLAAELPEFMIPAHLPRIDAIPLTPNGKLDRRALPDPETSRGEPGAPPRTETERVLVGIWAEVLGAERVGIHDDYYALGGDSLLMLRLRALAERQGIHFSLNDLVWHPTVAALAAHAATGAAGPAAELPPFGLVSRVDRARITDAVDAFPLTRLQLGLVYHSLQSEHSAVYHDVFRYRLAMAWDETHFRAAFARIAARHPALRSSFDLGGFTEPLQLVHADAPGGLDVVDLRGRPAPDAEDEIHAHIEQRRYHRYRFEHAPLYLFRAHVRDDGVDLVLGFHHALLDGGSVANLLTELLQDYLHALGADIGPVTDEAPPAAAHHLGGERAALADPAAREHWKTVTDGADALRLDGFAAAEPPRGDDLVVRLVELPDDVVRGARALAREQALPVKSLLFAAYALTLRLLSGADDFTTGLITHGRPEREGAERMVGLFLNTVPVRVTKTETEADGSWLDVVRELFRQERAGRPHQRYPLSAIQEDHGAPVLHTAFNYVHFHVLSDVLRLPDVRLEEFTAWEETDFQLLVNAFTHPVDGSVTLRIDGEGRGITPAQAELFGDTYTEVLRRIVDEPDEAPDFAFLAEGAARTEMVAPFDEDVVCLFRRQADRTPDAPAVSTGERACSYRELAEHSERVARRLVALGARPGARVGIAMDRSPETIAAILGTAMAGAACVPLDTGYPAARIAAMVADAEPFRIIARAADAGSFGEGAPLLTAESLFDDEATQPQPQPQSQSQSQQPQSQPQRQPQRQPQSQHEPQSQPHPRVSEGPLDPASTAYILFTSGSTGRPKGVVMPHRSLANLIGWQIRATSAAAGGTTAQYAPLSFDVSFQEIYSTLCSGGTLRLVAEAERRDMPALLRMLDREGVARIFLPYVALQQLAEASAALGVVPRGLRVICSSGEQLRVTDEIRTLLAALPGAVLENQYGPTESHVVSTHTLAGDPAAFPAIVPIGAPISGADVLVLDPKGRPVPTGVQGELFLTGAALADGYLGDPALTEERFVPVTLPGGAVTAYRTGDLGLVLPDGSLAYAGRADTQVKIRGYRVEPAEAEVALVRLAAGPAGGGIKEAAVVARAAADGSTGLVAFLVGDPESTDLVALRGELRTLLPEFMVPDHFAWLPELPLTPSGKRDDGALRTLRLDRPEASDGQAPRDAYERTLAELLGGLLGVGSVGVHDDIFALGATSLTTMRLVVLIEQRYGVTIPISGFIAAPTVAALAELLRSGGATLSFDPLVPIRAEGERTPLFLAHPMGGNVLCYVPLARHLPEGQPLFAFQASGGDLGTEPLRSVPDIAASYIEAMRRVRPQGPYVVGGWSFGGFVAFEMARQLRAAGDEVAEVILLDTVALGPAEERQGYTDEALLGWFFWELLLLGRGGDSPIEAIPAELTTLDEKFGFIARTATDEGILPADSDGSLVGRLFRVYEANWRATQHYQPEPGADDITLIRASEPLPRVLRAMHGAGGTQHTDPANGWHTMTTGHVKVVHVPGDHLSIMEEPHVADVAAAVAELAESGTAEKGKRRV
ncbi:amino acid adenylation domain-containing protein [Streptomyces kanamyceticus]|uniref:Non-ribosomal peptide synthetase n=1 Tax=Streptomyces kanamyceticus TaxID=1967 RepID=A0A5J6GBQ3_STRKN|nr:non-ribosomal peptide synthetase [Streptomyces kanamyceticus]QEU90696.1 non-ribosomal peptide synthetase [Streptomyces kanamyceticus]